ncbi:MAG: L-arabinose isomerase, partial [Limisphaerales bacterium]
MTNLKQFEVWFITGSQHLYGSGTLKQVETHSREIASSLGMAESIPIKLVFKAVMKTQEEVSRVCIEANSSPGCIGLITWC